MHYYVLCIVGVWRCQLTIALTNFGRAGKLQPGGAAPAGALTRSRGIGRSSSQAPTQRVRRGWRPGKQAAGLNFLFVSPALLMPCAACAASILACRVKGHRELAGLLHILATDDQLRVLMRGGTIGSSHSAAARGAAGPGGMGGSGGSRRASGTGSGSAAPTAGASQAVTAAGRSSYANGSSNGPPDMSPLPSAAPAPQRTSGSGARAIAAQFNPMYNQVGGAG